MSDKMVTLGTFANPIEAQLVVGRLGAEGIRAVVMGGASSDVFAGMGAGLAHVEVFVAESDFDRALDVLEAGDEADEADEESTTAIKEAARRKSTSPHVRPPRASPLTAEAPGAEGPGDVPDDPDADLRAGGGDGEREASHEIVMTPDAVAHRAVLAALFSFACFPLGIYSLWLLVRLPFLAGELSQAGTLKAYAALGLNALVWVGLALASNYFSWSYLP